MTFTEPCDEGGEPLIAGKHYVQNEYLRPYQYSPDFRAGIWEPKRGPENARIDFEGEGDMTGSENNYLYSLATCVILPVWGIKTNIKTVATLLTEGPLDNQGERKKIIWQQTFSFHFFSKLNFFQHEPRANFFSI